MGKPRTTPKLEAKAIKDYLETKSVFKAAKRCGLGSTTVHRILKRNGIEATGQKEHYKRIRKLPESEALKAEYEAGSHMKEIAQKYGTCIQTVHEALQKAGADMRRRGGQRRLLSPAEKLEVVELYSHLGSQTAVAVEMGLSQGIVSKTLRRAGVSTGRLMGENHPNWKGGTTVTSGGYVQIKIDADDPLASMTNGEYYVMEHRLVMARKLDRMLTENETVHHINGDTKDNRIENLQLRQGKHGKGVVHICQECGSTNVRTEKLN